MEPIYFILSLCLLCVMISSIIATCYFFSNKEEELITNRMVAMAELGYEQVSDYGLSEPVWQISQDESKIIEGGK